MPSPLPTLSDMLARITQRDPRDLSAAYNTQLAPQEEAAFQRWAAANGRTRDLYDYDMRGAWKAQAQQGGNGHFPDTYKKPNHPTFSNESEYAVGPVLQGGRWGANSFTPGPTNLQFHPAGELSRYLARFEPGIALNLPAGKR